MDHNVVKHHFVISVAEVNVIECDVSLQFLISCAVIRLFVIVLPRPVAGMLFSFDNIALFIIFTVDQHDISVVCLRFFVKKFEDALCARKSHNDTVELHAHLVDRHAEALVKSQETRQAADCKARVRIEGEKAPHERHDHVVGIAHLRVDRTDHICKGVCLVGALVELFIELIESLY